MTPLSSLSFRMRQVNIVGTSPPSLPSRRIQTLQAPPDMAPANVTLRTASETSLWLRWMVRGARGSVLAWAEGVWDMRSDSACPWQPLLEQEYNGNPDSVGYRIRYSRADGRGQPALHVIRDRVEREFTIEDLEEWTEYRVQVQAFNAIGSGPWSPSVLGRTRESGTAAHLGTGHPPRPIRPLTLPVVPIQSPPPAPAMCRQWPAPPAAWWSGGVTFPRLTATGSSWATR